MRLMLPIFLILFSMPVLAAVSAGDKLPNDLALLDQNGAQQSFESVKGEKGAVIVFVRSADWCPYCQVQLLDLKDNAAAITDLGYNIVTISYDAPDVLKTFAEKYSFPYTMLSDKGSETIKAFGILNEDFEPDHFAYGVPHPNIYVVGADGTIQNVLSEEGYKLRPQVEAIVEAIQAQ